MEKESKYSKMKVCRATRISTDMKYDVVTQTSDN